MKIISFLKRYFTDWRLSTIIMVCCSAIYFLDLLIHNNFINEVFPYIILITFLFVTISAIVQFLTKKWIVGLLQCLLVLLNFFFLSLILSGEPDYYAYGLKLPKGVALEKPFDISNLQQEDSLIASDPKPLKFVIVNSFQPGIYEYYAWLEPKETGFVYIKAFEITKNDQLSGVRIKERSKQAVKPGKLSVYHNNFTIYEGNWGQYYGARIELWLIPDKGGKEYKLSEKNYIVEGWQR